MTRKNPPAKWTLPDVVDPEGRICFLVRVPDDPLHLAAFRGALLNLASAYKWQDDEAHTAKSVALVWREIVDNVESRTCLDPLIDVRQNGTEPCTLEKSIDGVTWSAWADLQLCPPRIRSGPGGGLEFFDGTGWVPLPGTGDERTDGTYDPPWPPGTVPAGETGNCLAAENIAAFFVSSLTQMRQGLEAGLVTTSILGLLMGAVSLFMPWALFAAFGLIFADAVEGIGIAGIDDLLAGDTVHKFKCIINCNAEADGSITASEYTSIYNAIGTDIGGAYGALIQNWIDGFGPVGLSRQGKASGITSGSCGDCGCSTIGITYIAPSVGSGVAATGPSSCTSGDTVTMTSDSGGFFQCQNIYFIQFQTDACAKYTIMGVTGATLFACDPSTNIPKYWYDCVPVIHNPGSISAGNSLITVGDTFTSATILSVNSGTAFSIDVKIESYP